MGILIILIVLVILLIFGSIVLFFTGLIMMNNNERESQNYLKGKKFLKVGLGTLIFTGVAFIIGFSICLNNFSLGPMH